MTYSILIERPAIKDMARIPIRDRERINCFLKPV